MSLQNILMCIITSFIQSVGLSFVMFKQIEDKNIADKFKFIFFMWIYGVISFLYIPNQLRFIMFVITIIIILYFILKIKDKIILMYAFNTTLIFSISEIFVAVSLVLLGINSKDIVNDIIINVITNIIISIFSIILICIPLVLKTLKKINEIFLKKKSLSYYLIMFLVMIYIIVSKNGLEFILESNYYVNAIFIIGIIVTVFVIFKSEAKSEKLLEMNQQMLNYVTKYEKIITEQGKANHEFKNQLMVIRGYAQMNSSNKLLEYLDSITDDIKKTHSSYLISNLNKFPDGGIKGLLYYKLSVMDDEKIKYEINVREGVKAKLSNLSTIEYKNITKVLGVLLDNAIDASKKCKNKKVIIMVEKNKESVDFKIYNTCKEKVDISKLGTGYTTKGNGHGYGLRLVKDIINDNSYLDIERYLEDNYYVSVLHINNKKAKNF